MIGLSRNSMPFVHIACGSVPFHWPLYFSPVKWWSGIEWFHPCPPPHHLFIVLGDSVPWLLHPLSLPCTSTISSQVSREWGLCFSSICPAVPGTLFFHVASGNSLWFDGLKNFPEPPALLWHCCPRLCTKGVPFEICGFSSLLSLIASTYRTHSVRVQPSISQLQHSCHLGPDNSLLWGVVLCIAQYLAAPLISTH